MADELKIKWKITDFPEFEAWRTGRKYILFTGFVEEIFKQPEHAGNIIFNLLQDSNACTVKA